MEIEGETSFVGADDGLLTLELLPSNGRKENAAARMTVRVLDWGNQPTAQLSNRKLRLRGVCERAFDENGEPTTAILWMQAAQQLTPLEFVKPDGSALQVLPMFNLTPGNLNLAWGRKVLVRGTVISSDAKSGAVTLRGEDSFYAYSSSDGAIWNPVGSPVPVAMEDSIFAGLAISAVTNFHGMEATFTQVSADVSESLSVGLGNTPTNGAVTLTGANVTIRPGGGNDWDGTDMGLFLCQPLVGDGEIIARLESLKTTRPSDKAGLMMRESLNADAPYVTLVMKNGTRLDPRP